MLSHHVSYDIKSVTGCGINNYSDVSRHAFPVCQPIITRSYAVSLVPVMHDFDIVQTT